MNDNHSTPRGLRPLRGVPSIALAMMAAGCASVPATVDESRVTAVNERASALITQRLASESERLRRTQDELRRSIEQPRPAPAAPVPPAFDPLDSIRVTLRVQDADARTVFRAIADAAKMNLAIAPSLARDPRRISLSLVDMPASHVLDQALRTLDVSGSIEHGMLTVREHEERTFNLDALQTVMQADFTAGGDVFGANSSVSSDSGGSGQRTTGIQGAFSVRGRNTNNTDPMDQVERLLKTILGSPDGAASGRADARAAQAPVVEGNDPNGVRYVLNRASGSLYVKARPSQVRAIARMVDQYKGVLGRQVLIEAQILDVELSDEFRYGLDWTSIRNRVATNFGQAPLTSASGTAMLPNAVNPPTSVTIPGRVLGTLGTTSLGMLFQSSSAAIALDLMKQFGTVHVLSNPSLRVKNTQPAVVSVGSTERYVVQTTSNVSNSGGGQVTTSSNVVTGNLFDGVLLGVIPFVAEDGSISLTINPMQTKVQPNSTTPVDVGGPNNPLRVSLPKVDFKGMTTSLSLRDGDTVILGGLISDAGGQSRYGVPGLSDVPFVGQVLGGQSRTARARELVIVLRVQVL